MKIPPHLVPGDKVAIVSPASPIDRAIVEQGANILRQQGLLVEIGAHTCDRENAFSASDQLRAADLQKALDDKSIKAIFFSRGGYGSLRTHLLINWSSFFKRPKWLIGFSDITVFHSYLSNHHIASLHGVMTAWFEQNGEKTDSFIQLMDILYGKWPNYQTEAHPFNRLGHGSGILIGGNLSLLYALRGTPLDLQPKGKILFLEDIGEYPYHIDRMMQNLKASGILKQLSGLIVGYFTDTKKEETPFGQTPYQIIREAVSTYHYPVLFEFPAGHELPNCPLVLGSRISLEISEKGGNIVSLQTMRKR